MARWTDSDPGEEGWLSLIVGGMIVVLNRRAGAGGFGPSIT